MNLGEKVVAVYIVFKWLGFSDALPSPEVHVDGYQELEEPFYPFQQYIQVRKTYTVEHVPVYEDHPSSSSSSNLQVEASNSHGRSSNGDHQGSPTQYDTHHQNHYEVPKLREEIKDYTKHEVYEEKGYGDSAYDHMGHGHRGKYDSPSDYHGGDDSDHYEEAGSHPARKHGKHAVRAYTQSLHTPDGSSTKLLEYVASTQHDRDAEEKGIYSARDNIYCPEVIDFDLSSKSMKMGQGGRSGAKPRLSGLGSKISCLKNKYFGREPLPRAIFSDPSESKHSPIQVPSYDNFFKMIRQNVDSSSSFQHSRVPF